MSNTPTQMNEREVQDILVRSRWSWRQFLIVPNTNGLLQYEADLLIVSAAGYLTEVEIKVSRADLRADLTKSHGHVNGIVKSLWFAGPEELTDALIEFAPPRAGILVVRPNYFCREIRKPKRDLQAPPLTWKQRYKLARLGSLRYWDRRLEGHR